jgi:16S rRNA C967 or C1407 C5-methylase (RsmB/RsmF family)
MLAMKQTKAKGLSAFNDHFSTIYAERWPTLAEALAAPRAQSALINPFADLGLRSPYYLDEASLLAAQALPIKAGDRVLDMCAAPGGKALSLIFKSQGDVSFVLNERSSARRARLQRVVEEYLPSEVRTRVKVTGHDATKWCLHEQAAYEAILLDAPCSSERHLLEKPDLMRDWSKTRSQTLAISQFAMLASACDAVKPLGFVLYATCSISPVENDGVLQKLEKKRTHMERIALHFDLGEATSHGWIFLPDTSKHGPLYLSLLRRKAP